MTDSTIKIFSWYINGSVLTKQPLLEKFIQHETSFKLFVLCSIVLFFCFVCLKNGAIPSWGVGGT